MPTGLFRSASPATSESNFQVRDLGRRSPWVWWHLLSLDAPTVAVVWCWFFGAVLKLHFSWVTLPTLALGTWCVYVADRLLDGWRSTDTIALRDRHWFYLRHRRLFVIAWAIAAVPLAYLIFFRVESSVRTDDIVLCLIGVAYFLLIHGRIEGRVRGRIEGPSSPSGGARLFPHWLPKEMAVGFLFATATAVPAWARLNAAVSPVSSPVLLAVAVLTFGAVCWLNCVAIQTWEDAEAAQEIVHTILSGNPYPDITDPPRGLTEFLGAHLTAFAIAVGTAALVLAVATAGNPVSLLFTTVVLSAALFLGLIHCSSRFSALSLRIAADAALLTPLLFLFRLR